MTITHRVKGAFFSADSDSDDARLIRLAPNAPPSKGPTRRQGRPWTHEEHDRFLHAMEIYPSGPWKDIADYVGTRTTRQTMTHAQKYRQKIARWKRGATIKPSATSSSSSDCKIDASCGALPASPQAAEDVDMATGNANEDAMFWQVLEEMFEGSDDASYGESMTSLLHGSSPTPFASTLYEAHLPVVDAAHDMNPVHEDICVYV